MSIPRGFVPRFLNFWRTGISGAAGSRLGVAVSGGADSSVLAALLHKLKAHLGIRRMVLLHLDHGLRPAAERRRDAAVLRHLARRVRAPIVTARARIRAGSEGLEAAARAARLDFFRKAARRHKLDSVALAHHLDDRIETFFLNLLRGSGSRGLSSLRAIETIDALRLVRPLLVFTRDEIRGVCSAERIVYHEDVTNRDRRFLRNRIRLDLVPMLKEWHPGFEKAMFATIETLESEDAALSELAAAVLQSNATAHGRGVTLDRAPLRRLPAALLVRVLQQADRRLGGSGLLGGHENLSAAARIILGPATAAMNLPAGRSIRIEPNRVVLSAEVGTPRSS